MHLLPSRSRPDWLARFFALSRPQQPGIVIIDPDQASLYEAVRLPDGWRRLVMPTVRAGYVKCVNAAFESAPAEPWYSLVGDDLIGRTPGWDTELGRMATPNRIAWGNDLVKGLCTQPFVGGDLVRAVGWFGHPALGHLWCDTVWSDIAIGLGIGTYRPDIITEHLHFAAGKADRRDYAGRVTAGDGDAYAEVCAQQMPALLALLKPIAEAA